MEKKEIKRCINENEVRYFVGMQKTCWNSLEKTNVRKRKQKIEKMYKNDFLSASWKLLCLGTEKKNSYYSIFKSGYLTRISAPSPTIYRISSFNKQTNKQKKYRLPNTLETTRIKLINDCISSDDLLFVLSKNVVSF